MKAIFLVFVVGVAGVFAADSDEVLPGAFSLPFDRDAKDPSIAISVPEVGIYITKVEFERQVTAYVLAILAADYFVAHRSWPSSVDQLISTLKGDDPDKMKSWLNRCMELHFEPAGETLSIRYLEQEGDQSSVVRILLASADTAEAIANGMKISKGGEPGATDNPDGAQ